MSTAAEAATAISEMNGVMLDVRPLKVNEAQERQPRSGPVGGGGRW